MSDPHEAHKDIRELQIAMLGDATFRGLCEKYELPWDPKGGYQPRWYNGPPPEDVRLLFLMAEPAPVGPRVVGGASPAVTNNPWIRDDDPPGPHNYWVENVRQLCAHVWPDQTVETMNARVGGSCTFWMSLPAGASTSQIPPPLLKFFLKNHLSQFLRLFPRAVILAAGAKARDRMRMLDFEYESCWAFTRPGCNQHRARESWKVAGESIRSILSLRGELPPP